MTNYYNENQSYLSFLAKYLVVCYFIMCSFLMLFPFFLSLSLWYVCNKTKQYTDISWTVYSCFTVSLVTHSKPSTVIQQYSNFLYYFMLFFQSICFVRSYVFLELFFSFRFCVVTSLCSFTIFFLVCRSQTCVLCMLLLMLYSMISCFL